MNAQTTRQILEEMSPSDFASLGLQELAYVKPVEVEGGTGYAIYAADGTQLTVVDDRETAFAVIRQNDLEPVSAH